MPLTQSVEFLSSHQSGCQVDKQRVRSAFLARLVSFRNDWGVLRHYGTFVLPFGLLHAQKRDRHSVKSRVGLKVLRTAMANRAQHEPRYHPDSRNSCCLPNHHVAHYLYHCLVANGGGGGDTALHVPSLTYDAALAFAPCAGH